MLNLIFIKLGIAVLVGGIVGLEREFQYKAAGFRTIILITIGSTLYTLFSISMAGTTESATPIASNIVTGIGFLGAATILRDGGHIGGLTTAAVDAIQINTGSNCHLEASMIQKALEDFDLTSIDVLFIENVGNLICPTHWSLGEHIKICLLSTPEGHDKPVKYPEVFAANNAILLNKIDLMDRVDFDRDFFYQSVRTLNPRAPIFELSCRNGEGIDAWIAWLRDCFLKTLSETDAADFTEIHG